MTRPNSAYRSGKISLAVVMTGGTIAKIYDPTNAELIVQNEEVRKLFGSLRADDVCLTYYDLFELDSQDIGEPHRDQIVAQLKDVAEHHDAVLVLHGTDTLTHSAQRLQSSLAPAVPIIFTGAMVPNSVKGSDAVQNVTEALLAARLLPAGIYVVFHNRILCPPDLRKNRETLTFEEIA